MISKLYRTDYLWTLWRYFSHAKSYRQLNCEVPTVEYHQEFTNGLLISPAYPLLILYYFLLSYLQVLSYIYKLSYASWTIIIHTVKFNLPKTIHISFQAFKLWLICGLVFPSCGLISAASGHRKINHCDLPVGQQASVGSTINPHQNLHNSSY